MWKTIGKDELRHIVAQAGAPEPPDPADLDALATRFHVDDSAVFHFSMKQQQVGDATISLLTTSPFSYAGAPESEADDVHIGFLLHGSASLGFEGRGRESHNSARPYAVSSWGRVSLECVSIVRSLDIRLSAARLDSRGIRIHREGWRLNESISIATPLRMFALAVIDSAWKPTQVGSAVTERAIEDLVVGLFLERQGYTMDSGDLRAGLRARANAVVSADHHLHELSPALVATRLSVSIRHLQRAFEDSGTSVAQLISSSRAESAGLLLRSPAGHRLTISEIAARAGFASTFELRSAFRARFGVLPSSYRREFNDDDMALDPDAFASQRA